MRTTITKTCLCAAISLAALTAQARAAEVINETAKLVANDGATAKFLGFSVAVSGDRALVGAYADTGINSGAAYLFDLTTGTQVAKLIPSDGALGDQFGISVALSGDLAVIGAGGDDDNGTQSGSAYFFELGAATGTVTETAKLLPSDGAAFDVFAFAPFSVAVSGERAVVGAYREDQNGPGSGSAYLFDLQGATGVVNEIAKLLPSDGAHPQSGLNDQFGYSVALSGDTAVISAVFDDENGIDSGSAYFFDLGGVVTGTVHEVAKLLPSDGAPADRFGYSVALSGELAVIGAYFDDDNGTDSGSAYLFDLGGGVTGTVNEVAKLLPGDPGSYDEFGRTVAVDGVTAVVGAYFDNDNGTRSGSAYLFDLSGAAGIVNNTAKLLPSDGFAFDRFGSAVGVSGGNAVVGAYFDDASGTSSGSAYLFQVTLDADGDGIPDSEDPFPNSDNSETIIIDGVDTGIDNDFLGDGTYLSDLIGAALEADAAEGDSGNEEVVEVLLVLKAAGWITGREMGEILREIAGR